tara:strand:+ start:7182 stop:7313 length:132 start_codon:yes stop_codon:yes gene_type:complete
MVDGDEVLSRMFRVGDIGVGALRCVTPQPLPRPIVSQDPELKL